MIAEAKETIISQERPVSPSSLAAQLGCGEGTIQRWLTELGDESRVGVRSRQSADTRKGNILAAALIVAERDGFHKMTRKAIATEAYVSEPLVNKYLGTLPNLRRTVMRMAIKHEVLAVIAQGIATGNAYATGAPEELKARALASLT
jgi:AcrR family transcriptional regulator